MIEPLAPSDLATVRQLLTNLGLPGEDCQHPDNRFFGIRSDGHLLACGGLQQAGDCALLRSVAVLPAYQGRGLGRQMVNHLLQQATADGFSAIYLLTETSSLYFQSLGFTPVERSQVPPAITATAQFSSLCPDSADCLMKQLQAT